MVTFFAPKKLLFKCDERLVELGPVFSAKYQTFDLSKQMPGHWQIVEDESHSTSLQNL